MQVRDGLGRGKKDGSALKMLRVAGRRKSPGRRNQLRRPRRHQCWYLGGGQHVHPLGNLSQELVGVGLFLFDRQ